MIIHRILCSTALSVLFHILLTRMLFVRRLFLLDLRHLTLPSASHRFMAQVMGQCRVTGRVIEIRVRLSHLLPTSLLYHSLKTTSKSTREVLLLVLSKSLIQHATCLVSL